MEEATLITPRDIVICSTNEVSTGKATSICRWEESAGRLREGSTLLQYSNGWGGAYNTRIGMAPDEPSPPHATISMPPTTGWIRATKTFQYCEIVSLRSKH